MPTLQRPANDDKEAWKAYWKEQGQSWRTEPEIDAFRQKYLAVRRAITPNIEQGIYPFKDIKLSRADVEWLLVTHENGRGPVDWSDERQRERNGLDVRGANLRQEDLNELPLARLRGGLDGNESVKSSIKQLRLAAVHLEGTNLSLCHLEGAHLSGAHLEDANFYRAYLVRADFYLAHLEGVSFSFAHLEGASLRNAFLDKATTLFEVILGNKEFGFVLLSNIHWSEANLSFVNWTQVKELGDEHEAKQPNMWFGQEKNRDDRLRGYQRAVYANRQLATALLNQGLNEDAASFFYRARLLQRVVLRQQKKVGQYFFSLFLDLLAGYGYKFWRSFLTYLLVIGLFASIYYLFSPHLAWNEAIVISMTAFHGRGFFPEQFHPGDPQALVAAIEAFVGLLIEITLIATLTQRFFGK